MRPCKRSATMVSQLGGGRFWSGLTVFDLKPRLNGLWKKPKLSTTLTRPASEEAVHRICACSNERDAIYYACSHNKNDKDPLPS